MRCRTRQFLAFILCLACMILGGCWDQKIFEDIGFIVQMGLEMNEAGDLVYSITMPVVVTEAKDKTEILAVSDPLMRGCREKIRNVAGKRVEGGKTQVIHISKELAQRGIISLFDVYIRSPENPLLANITVVDGSPYEMFMLSKEFKDKPRPMFYVLDLLANARKNAYTPDTRIFDFYILTHSKTIDPVTPLLHYDDKSMEIAGSALFSGDKMVGEIDRTQTGLLHMLMGEKLNFHYGYFDEAFQKDQSGPKAGLSILVKNASKKVEIGLGSDPPVLDIKLKISATIEENGGALHLDDPAVEKRLEKGVASSLEKDCERLIGYLQEVGSDPLGFGEMVRVKSGSGFKAEDWKKVYPKVQFQVEAEVNIVYYGAIN